MRSPTPHRILAPQGSCAVCGGNLAGQPIHSCGACRTAIHAECEAWTPRCPTYGCTGALGSRRRWLGALPPPGRRSSFAPQSRQLGPLPPPGQRQSFARQPRPIPVHAPRDGYSFSKLFEGLFDPVDDSGLLAIAAFFLVVGVLGLLVAVPSLAPKSGGTRVLLMLLYWAQATRSSAQAASSTADGFSSFCR